MNEKITLSIPPDLCARFRKVATNRFEDKKGKLSKAGIEAIEMWLKENESPP